MNTTRASDCTPRHANGHPPTARQRGSTQTACQRITDITILRCGGVARRVPFAGLHVHVALGARRAAPTSRQLRPHHPLDQQGFELARAFVRLRTIVRESAQNMAKRLVCAVHCTRGVERASSLQVH